MSARALRIGRSAPAPSPMICVGEFRVTQLEPGKVWVERVGGEGMETTEAKLEAVLEKFWRKEF